MALEEVRNEVSRCRRIKGTPIAETLSGSFASDCFQRGD